MDSESALTNNMSFQILILVVLTLVNAFFASSEMAIVSLNRNRIKILANEGSKKADTLLKLIEEPTNFLSTIQVGITLSGFFASASAATGISQYLGNVLKNLGVPYGYELSFVGITIILSYFTLVFGELVPKRIALAKAEKIAFFSLKPVLLISKITLPFVKILSFSTNLMVKILAIEKGQDESKVTKEEIKSLIEEGEEDGTIDESEKEMIEGVFEFKDKRTEKIMIPRTQVYCIDIEDKLDIDELLKSKKSRIPVYEGNIDNIKGIISMKDLMMEARKKGFDKVAVKDILKKPYFVHESTRIHSLLKYMRETKTHMAIVIDEYGGFSGIVTIKDLVEEIVGEIDGEYEESGIKQIDKNTFEIKGVTPIEEINDKLDVQLECKDVETLSGFLINILGKIPTNEDETMVKYGNLRFKIDKFNDKIIEKVVVNRVE